MTSEENIKVLIRIRPSFDSDSQNYLSKYKESDSIVIPSELEPKIFNFDKVADENTTQEEIFKVCQGLFESFFAGYNCTIFAYGQTSSGKTYTMTGDTTDGNVNDDPGVVPQGLQFIFDKINENTQLDQVEYLVKCSFVEIYNEQLFDLLDPKGKRVYLKMNLSQGVYVDKLTEKVIVNTHDALKILEKGLSNRHVASTAMNRESSRSHAVFSIILESCVKEGDIDNIRKSVLHLVDLAGSERQRDTKSESTRLKEAGSINKSLHVLGQVISSHVDIANGKKRYIRYRDSRLTQLLKDSIGGNSKTFLVACIHPDRKYINETLSTLQFASRVKMIRNKAKINLDVCGNVEALQREVVSLREQLMNTGVSQIGLKIQITEFDNDSIWKKRFIHAMGLRMSLSRESCTLKEQLALSYSSHVSLEETIQLLKEEAIIKDTKIDLLKNKSIPDIEAIRELIDNALSKIKEEVEKNMDRVKIGICQTEINSLRSQLDKVKQFQSLAISEPAMIQALYNEYNDIVGYVKVDNSIPQLSSNQLEGQKLQEELSEAKILISQLKKQSSAISISREEERRKLESEIASLKSMLKSSARETEKVEVKRRQTLFHFINQKPLSPVMTAPGINRSRRATKGIKANALVEEEFDDFNNVLEDKNNVYLEEVERINNELKVTKEKNCEYKKKIATLTYDNNNYSQDICNLKIRIKDQEELETNYNGMREKCNILEIDLQDTRDMMRRLDGQLKDLNSEKDRSIKNLQERVRTLEIELDDAFSEKDLAQNELEVVRSEMDLLKDATRQSDSFNGSSHRIGNLMDSSKMIGGADAGTVASSIISEVEELRSRLSDAYERIDTLTDIEAEHICEISELENNQCELNEQIEVLQKELADLERIKNEELLHQETLLTLNFTEWKSTNEEKHKKEVAELRSKLDSNQSLIKELEEQLRYTKIDLNSVMEEMQGLKNQENSTLVLEDVLAMSERLEKDLANEKENSRKIKSILENTFYIADISCDRSSMTDKIQCLEAKIISYQKDIQDYKEIVSACNAKIATKDNYIYELSTNLRSANEQRQALKSQNDDLIKSYGHSNYKQKIQMMTKLNGELFKVREENIELTDRLNRLRVGINKCDPKIRNSILRASKENISPLSANHNNKRHA